MKTTQTPIHSGFGAASTAREVLAGVDLHGKHAIVTGGYSGIGVETVRALTRAGARVVVPARDLDKARRNLHGIDVDIVPMDLADPASIDAFAEQYLSRDVPLHILINSAGIMACPLTRDARGYELQFATNHLGHFQLTARLWPALKRAGESGGARVVALSSLGHRYAAVDLDDPHFNQRAYDPWLAYGQSKTANALFAVGLDARGRAHGVRAFSVHPGGIITDLARYMSEDELKKIGALDENGQPVTDLDRGYKNVQQGAATSVWAATSPQLQGKGGVYCENCDIAQLVGDLHEIERGDANRSVGVCRWATDAKAAEGLWVLSEAQTGADL
ncbi:oxidoreductase [Oleiagrimonas sp. C23AA]|uniref:oxidoreductase n=1 Tax=Oleiagrimonas sp. C23AA TaxID=2719047 RepID=UPI0014202323|nr:oxidoreductase [Oleiagrimonas sp. C23AA]NII11872.1 SDR family NAD(P)-dependent oxidoreductase [Oleiagrimonas sp. C23AA]